MKEKQMPFVAYCRLLVAVCLLPFSAFAIELSDSSRITALTCAPGEELYSAFGHNGIRVTDFKNDFDVVFNYGTFDFEQPGFYTNFVKGDMLYMVSTDRFEDFLRSYTYEKRKVTEQELNLTTDDKKRVFAFLYNNALPENCEYRYDFFWDNCATRPRDVFEKILGNRLQYHTDSAGFEENKTMHDMLRIYVGNRPWVALGFDLILGLPCEVNATPRNQTFLPEYLARYFACATIDGEPFVTKTEVILNMPPAKIETPVKPIYVSLAVVLLAFVVWYFERKRVTHYFAFDFLLFFSTGILGTLFLLLWLFSSHYSVPQNLNLLWLIPSHLIVSFFLLFRQKGVWIKYYLAATYIVMMFVLLAWQWLPQHFNVATMPLVFLMAFRSASGAIYLHFKNRI